VFSDYKLNSAYYGNRLKEGRMRGQVSHIEDFKKAYQILVEKPEGKRPAGSQM
jgi:hypothetical protein